MPYGCDKPAVITIPRPLAVRLHVIIGQHGRTFVGEAQNALAGWADVHEPGRAGARFRPLALARHGTATSG
jgi:hypothetical protein